MSGGTSPVTTGAIGAWACDALTAAVMSSPKTSSKAAFDALDKVPPEELRRVAGFLAAVAVGAAQNMSARERRRPADFVDRLRMELAWSEP